MPDPDCECGVRAVGDVEVLLEYMEHGPIAFRSLGSALLKPSPLDSTTRQMDPYLTIGPVLGRVVLGGHIGGPTKDDPPTTVRAGWGRLGSDLYFPRGVWDGADAFEQAYRGRVTVHRVAELSDVPELAHARR